MHFWWTHIIILKKDVFRYTCRFYTRRARAFFVWGGQFEKVISYKIINNIPARTRAWRDSSETDEGESHI